MARRKLNAIEQKLAELSRSKVDERMAYVLSLKVPLTFDEEITLLGLIDDPSEAIRHEAMEKLFEQGGRWARIAVRAVLAQKDKWRTDAHLEMLGVIGAKRDSYLAERFIYDSDWIVRCSAACCLGDLGGKKARTLLKQMVENEPHSIARCWAYSALLETKRDGDAEDIHAFLKTQYPLESGTARIELLMGLYQFGERERLPEILQFMTQDDANYISRLRVCRGLLEWIDPEDTRLVLETIRPYATLCHPASYRESAREIVEMLESSIAQET